MIYTVSVGFDEASHRYFVAKSEIPGLSVETETFEQFVEMTKKAVPDLLEYEEGLTIKFEREIYLAA